MGFTWASGQSPEQVFVQGTDDYIRSIHDNLLALANSFAPRIEAWMKQNAKWEDQTGNLRQSLYAEVEDLVKSIAIHFDYGLDYGIFLETMQMARFAIVAPALDVWSIEIWKAVKALMSS